MSYRNIHTGNQVWEYRVGKKNVTIRLSHVPPAPKNSNYVVPIDQLLGVDKETYLDEDNLPYHHFGPVKPFDIKKYIETHLA